MELQALNCNICGAQLHVSETAKFVTCAHCDAQLAIRRSDSSLYTEQIAQIKEQTSAIAEHLAQVAYERKLEQIDEEWDEEESEYFGYDEHGTVSGSSASTFGGGLLVILGIVAFVVTALPEPFRWLGLPMIVLGGFMVAAGVQKRREYIQAHSDYLRRRSKVKLKDFLPRLRRKKR